MCHKNVLLELRVEDRGVAPTESLQAKREAVKEAKRAVISALSDKPWWDPALEVLGESTMFRVLIVSGPDQALDELYQNVQEDLPEMVNSVERDWYFPAP